MTQFEQVENNIDSFKEGVALNTTSSNNELNLIDVLHIFNKHKKIIFIIFILFFSISVIVAMVLPRTYRSEIVVLPPFAKYAERLNIPDFYEVTTKSLYDKFIQNLQSIDLQKRFFNKKNMYEYLQINNDKKQDEQIIFYKYFHKMLNIEKINSVNGNNNTFRVTLDGKNKDQLVDWLNDFVLSVDEYTVYQVVDSIMVKAKVQAESVEKKISNLRETARKRRMDRIAVLEEAATVADKLQLDEPVGLIYSYRQKIKDQKGELVNIKETPSYLRGKKALKAEVDALKRRKNDDPFIESLRELQEEIAFYRGIVLTKEGLHAARIDQKAVALDKYIKPNIRLIILLGCIIGLVVGSFVAFFKEL